MTQEDKELLLVDLCARLPYGVIVNIKYNKEHGSGDRLRICSEGSLKLNTDLIGLYIEEEIHLKPYLRPMSSMTDEEVKYKLSTFFHIINTNIEGVGYLPTLNSRSAIKYIDWLNKNHFDYHGLIPMGLAIEVTKENNPYKT